jgi:hypothetical protein
VCIAFALKCNKIAPLINVTKTVDIAGPMTSSQKKKDTLVTALRARVTKDTYIIVLVFPAALSTKVMPKILNISTII